MNRESETPQAATGARVPSVPCRTCARPIDLAGLPAHLAAKAVALFQVKGTSPIRCQACIQADEDRRRHIAASQARRQREQAIAAIRENPRAALAAVGVPAHWRDASLDDSPDLPAALLADVCQWAERPEGTLYLHGPPGCGKTWTAAAVVRHVLEEGAWQAREIRFTTEAAFLEYLRLSFRDGTDAPVPAASPRHPKRIPLLVLDDLASTHLTDWGRSEIASLIAARHGTERPTIVTSNLDLDGLADAVDARVASRIAESGFVLAFPGTDLRVYGSFSRVPSPSRAGARENTHLRARG